MATVVRKKPSHKALGHWNQWDWFYIGCIILLLLALRY